MLQIFLHSKEALITSDIARKARYVAVNTERRRFLEYGRRVDTKKIEERLSQQKITMFILATLSIAGIKYQWRDKLSGRWFKAEKNVLEVVSRANGLYWQNGRKHRTLIYNLTVPLVKNNVDMCLFNAVPDSLDEANAGSYIALGELKGGIDPAGADEHWKTAKTALERIRKSFARAKQNPHTFFIGAAIEKKMATEIWDELQQRILSNAANLNDENQVASISHWLCNL